MSGTRILELGGGRWRSDLLQVIDRVGKGDAVATVDSGDPDLVHRRAESRILSALQSLHPASEVTRGDLLRLIDRAGECDRLDVAFLVFGDQYRQVVCLVVSHLVAFLTMRCSSVRQGQGSSRGWLLRPYGRRRGTDSRLFRQREAGFSKSRFALLCCSGWWWCSSSSFSITIDHSGGANEQEKSTYVSNLSWNLSH